MRILAIETSGRHGSLAALVGDARGDAATSIGARADGSAEGRIGDSQLLGQIVLSGPSRTAQTLAPAIKSLLAEVGWKAGSIELVAVTIGPGSFTGLRIGVTTAKTLAYAVGAGVIGVNTLDVLSAQAGVTAPGPLWAILDAQRQELYAAKFNAPPGQAAEGARQRTTPETRIVPAEAWLAELRPGDWVTGPPLTRLRPRLPAGVFAATEADWQPLAAAVGRVGWHAHCNGQRDDLWQLTPQYYRASAAEEKAATRPRV